MSASTTMNPDPGTGLVLSDAELTLAAALLGTTDLMAIGPLRPLEEPETLAASRTLAARQIIRPVEPAPTILLDREIAELLTPLLPGQPSTSAWILHPSLGLWSCVSTHPEHVTVASYRRAQRSWEIGEGNPVEVTAATLAMLARGLADPGAPGTRWEAGVVRTLDDGRQRGELFRIEVGNDGQLIDLDAPDTTGSPATTTAEEVVAGMRAALSMFARSLEH